MRGNDRGVVAVSVTDKKSLSNSTTRLVAPRRMDRGFHIFHSSASSIIARGVSSFWNGARSYFGSAVSKVRRMRSGGGSIRNFGGIWTVRISKESLNPTNGQKIEDSFEMDFESKEEAEVYAYQWHERTLHPKNGCRITYQAVIFLKGGDGGKRKSGSGSGTAAKDAIKKAWENGVVNPDYYGMEAEEMGYEGCKIEEVE